jgi:hypothetical protein
VIAADVRVTLSKGHDPGTAMPKLPMTVAERDALVQYLVGLK